MTATTPTALPRVRADAVVAVALGGAIGSLGRWAVAEALPHSPAELPWSTVLVNLTGAVLLGLLLGLLAGPRPRHHLLRPMLGTGLLGGWTTFSTAMLDAHALADAGRLAVAGGYLLGSVLVGLLGAWAGLRAGRVLAWRREREGPR
ncbi:fluoride efflux transporter FluC [Nocardioides nanhaiensis]|uniref:Fluoride-specific ion channel FluC n=1 Tax=Nocardioides nanhaiensis TaxID=1476871 RepID=A0ABP8WN63_9ACTN